MARLLAAFLLALAAGSSAAQERHGFDAAVVDVVSHNLAALTYLRGDKTGLALLELGRMRESFGLFAEHYGGNRPAAHRDNPDYVTMLVDVPLRMVTAHMMINFGRLPIAYNSLVATCRSLMDLRRAGADATAGACGEPIDLPPRP